MWMLCKRQGTAQVHVSALNEGIISFKDNELSICSSAHLLVCSSIRLFVFIRRNGLQIDDDTILKLRGTHVHDLSQFGLVICTGGKLCMIGILIYDCRIARMYIESDVEAQFESCQIERNGEIEIQVLGENISLQTALSRIMSRSESIGRQELRFTRTMLSSMETCRIFLNNEQIKA
jgi:hypothetical protein